MLTFREMLVINSKRNTDDIICANFIVGMRKFKEELEKKSNGGSQEEILQVEHRMKHLSTMFIDFEGNMEAIEEYDKRKYYFGRPKRENNGVDKKLQEIVRVAGDKVYKNTIGDREKVQVLDRTINVDRLLNDFDEYTEFLQTKKQRTGEGFHKSIIEDEMER